LLKAKNIISITTIYL